MGLFDKKQRILRALRYQLNMSARRWRECNKRYTDSGFKDQQALDDFCRYRDRVDNLDKRIKRVEAMR